VYHNFFELGGDSLLGIRAVVRARQAGLQITPKQLFRHQTVAELAALAVAAPASPDRDGRPGGAVPLLPSQQWFFEHHVAEPHHFNLALFLEVGLAPDAGLLRQAVQHLQDHHDALRLRFTRGPGGWQQSYAEAARAAPVARIDLAALPPAVQARALEAA